MSILIKGMEMPQDIREAIIITRGGKANRIRADRIIIEGNVEEANIAYELSPHGRLIDADALKIEMIEQKLSGYVGHDWREVSQVIDDAPTIIEAENPTQCNNSNTEESWTQIVCSKCSGKRFIAQGDIVVCDKCGAKMESKELVDELEKVECKRGKWLYTPTHWAYCSECGKEPPDECNIASNFCPNCGADMRESEDEK